MAQPKSEDAMRAALDSYGATVRSVRSDEIVMAAVVAGKKRRHTLAACFAAVIMIAASPLLFVFTSDSDSEQERREPAEVQEVAPNVTGDCLTGLEFNASAYHMIMGPKVRAMPLGNLVGTGTRTSCSDGHAGEMHDALAVQVYELAGVPPAQALLLEDPDGKGALYVANEIAGRLDRDLNSLLRRFSVPPASAISEAGIG